MLPRGVRSSQANNGSPLVRFGIAPQGFRPVTKKQPIRYNFGTFEKREFPWFSA
jgi:hypothetical protein